MSSAFGCGHHEGYCLGESHEHFSGCIGGTVEARLVFKTEDIRENRRIPGCCSSTSYGQALRR